MGSLRNCLELQQFLPLTQPPTGFCSQKLLGFFLLVLESWTGGAGVGLRLLTPEMPFPNVGVGPAHSRSAPPTSLDGCGFLNSIVVRLPFSSISDVPE